MIKEYILENEFVMVSFLNLGGILTKMIKKSNQTNYLLGYHDYNLYKENRYYFGATIGRVAGRVFPPEYRNSKGEQIELDINEGRVHLHGGKEGLHNQYWDVKQTGECEYTLSYRDEDSLYEEMDLKIIYRLEGNVFSIEYKGAATNPTLCNMTNHSYFNLNSTPSTTIKHHHLQTALAEIQLIVSQFQLVYIVI